MSQNPDRVGKLPGTGFQVGQFQGNMVRPNVCPAGRGRLLVKGRDQNNYGYNLGSLFYENVSQIFQHGFASLATHEFSEWLDALTFARSRLPRFFETRFENSKD